MLSLWYGYDTVTFSVLRPLSVEVVVHELDSPFGEPTTPTYSYRLSVWRAMKTFSHRNLLGVEIFGRTIR